MDTVIMDAMAPLVSGVAIARVTATVSGVAIGTAGVVDVGIDSACLGFG